MGMSGARDEESEFKSQVGVGRDGRIFGANSADVNFYDVRRSATQGKTAM